MKVDNENVTIVMTRGNGLMGLRRGIDLLSHLSRNPEGLTFGQVQEHMDNLPAPTLSRLLKVMADEELVTKDQSSGVYVTGAEARSLARGILGQATTEELVQPVVRSLAEATGQSAAYCEPRKAGFVFLVTENMPDSFHFIKPGHLNPRLVRHGFGQVCLAHADRRTVTGIMQKTEIPLPLKEKEFKERLARIRGEGCFVEAGEDRDACVRIAAPVFRGPGGPFAGALGITVLATKLAAAEKNRLAGHVRAAAARATELLAGSG